MPPRPPHLPPASPHAAWRWLARLLSVGLLALLVALAQAHLQHAPAVPFSDENGHVLKVLRLVEELGRHPGLGDRLFLLIDPREAYPALPHATSALTQTFLPGLDGVRAGPLLLLLLHAATALLLGPRLWGWPVTWAYVGLACGGPVVLTLGSLVFVDGPSAALAGIATLALLATDGFRRPGMVGLFVLAASAALLTKWILLVFLAPVVALEIGRGLWASTQRLGGRLALALLLLLEAAALGGAVWWLGAHPDLGPALADARQPWNLLRPMLAGVGLAALLALGGSLAARRGRAPPPALLAGLALVLVSLVAGPWYAGAQDELLGRLSHETTMYQQRVDGLVLPAQRLLAQLGDLVPLLLLALVPGLPFALVQPRRLAQVLAGLAAAGLGCTVVAIVLPDDLRYLLPAAPLLAAAAAHALAAAPRPLAWVLGLAVAGGQLALAVPALAPQSLAPLELGPMDTGVRRRLPSPLPPLPLGPTVLPDPLARDQVPVLLDALQRAGAFEGGELIVLESPRQVIQGRGVQALAAFEGHRLRVREVRDRGQLPTLAPGQLVLAAACTESAEPTPLARLPTGPAWCDLGLFRGALPPEDRGGDPERR